MASIYKNACIVIGASQSSSSNEHFLPTKNPFHAYEYVMGLKNEDGSTAQVYRTNHEAHGDFCSPFSYSTEDKRGPLAHRGWTLQEQILASRMVHLEEQEMFWECLTCMECECMELNSVRSYKSNEGDKASNQDYSTWHAIVSQYTRRNLTFGSDMLPALSGIASHIQTMYGGEYFAGIWKGNLVNDLLWTCREWGEPRQRAQPYRAPTWSWASTEASVGTRKLSAEIIFLSDDIGKWEPACRLVELYCTQAGKDQNGAVNGGQVTLEGTVLPVEHIENEVAGDH